MASRAGLAAAMVNDARFDLQRARARGMEVPQRRVAAKGARQGQFRARLPRSACKEPLLARGRGDECRQASCRGERSVRYPFPSRDEVVARLRGLPFKKCESLSEAVMAAGLDDLAMSHNNAVEWPSNDIFD